MTPPPTLSVVSPVYNYGRFLPQMLDSVARLATAHEHIVIDGGSTDGSLAVLERREDPALRWVSERDRGQTHAVNKGFALASGEFVGWLNGDDEYVAESVDAAVDHLRRHPDVAATFGGLDFIDEGGSVRREYRPGPWSWARLLFLGDYIPTPSYIFRRSLLETTGMLDERWIDAADYDFYLRLLQGRRVHRVPGVAVRFRVHAESKTTRNVQLQMDECLAIRLGWARGSRDRAVMRAAEAMKRSILPRISRWPKPY